jgi:hypothetical protein
MYDHLLDLFVPLLRKLKVIISTPYIWDVKGRKFELIKNKKYVKRFRIVSYIIYAHMVIMAWNLFQVFKKERNLLLEIFSLGTSAMTFFATVNRRMHQNEAAYIVQLLNCMVAFETSSTEWGNINMFVSLIHTAFLISSIPFIIDQF